MFYKTMFKKAAFNETCLIWCELGICHSAISGVVGLCLFLTRDYVTRRWSHVKLILFCLNVSCDMKEVTLSP